MDKEEKRRTQYALMAAMTHGGIGIWSRVALAPLDRIKILRQTQIIPGRNIFSDARSLWKNVGFFGLWWGCKANTINGASSAAVRIGAEQLVMRPLVYGNGPSVWWEKNSIMKNSFMQLGCASLALSILYPLDVIHTRQAASMNKTQFKSFFKALSCEVDPSASRFVRCQQFICSMYRGASFALIGLIPFTFVSNFVLRELRQTSSIDDRLIESYNNIYARIQNIKWQRNPDENPLTSKDTTTLLNPKSSAVIFVKDEDEDDEQNQQSASGVLETSVSNKDCQLQLALRASAFGVIAGASAQVVCYPIDTIRRRFIVHTGIDRKNKETHFVSKIRHELKSIHSPRQALYLYKGLGVTLIRIIPEVGTVCALYMFFSRYLVV